MSFTQFIDETAAVADPAAKETALVKRTSAIKNPQLLPGELSYPIDLDLEKLTINNLLVSTDLGLSITDGSITESMDQASTVQLVVHDKERKMVAPKGILSDWVSVKTPVVITSVKHKKKRVALPRTWNDVYMTLDKRDFALSDAQKSDNDYTLDFETRGVHELRKYSTPKKWARGQFTRAMAILQMIKEVKGYYIPYYIPELHTVEHIANSTQKLSTSEVKAAKHQGFALGAPVTVKHVRATPQQLNIIGRVIATGESMQASYKVLVSSIMTITQESDDTFLNGSGGYGPFSQLRNGAWPASVTDVEADAAGYFRQAIAKDRANPTLTPGQLAQAVQISAFPTAYDQWESEAIETLKLWGTSLTGSSATFIDTNTYYFTRGQSGTKEDSWTCILRLASEVGWHAFFVGNTFYYVEDNQLIRQMPRMTVSEKDLGIDTIDWQIDTNKTVNSVTVDDHSKRWSAPPGTTVVIEGEGPPDGPWVVHEVARPLFKGVDQITLALPVPPNDEPASTSKTTTVTGSSLSGGSPSAKVVGGDVVSRTFTKAREVSNQNLRYTWGGGHNAAFAPSPGYDCSGYVSVCLHDAGVLSSPLTSGGFETWGQAGQGQFMTIWCSSGHVFIEFKLPAPWGHCQANTSYPGAHGPLLLPWGSNGQADSASFVARHWAGT